MDISQIKKLRSDYEKPIQPFSNPSEKEIAFSGQNALRDAAPEIADECIRLAEENEKLKRMQSMLITGLQEGIDIIKKAREGREKSN